MQEALAVEPGRRPLQPQPQHQFAGVDLRRPKGYAAPAAAPAVVAEKRGVEGAGRDPCPRCASRDTKFCYYNNYNTAQPRHFCKACRRYWTKGGTLRNVPVGGGTRKKPSSSPSSYAAAGAADADNSKPQPPKKKPASKKRRVVAPAAGGAVTDPVDSAKTTTTTTTDGASDITTETAAVAPAAMMPAAAEDDSDSLAHLLLQPGAEAEAEAEAVALGLGLSDFPSAAPVGNKALLYDDADDSFVWPAAFDLGACWATATAGIAADPEDPAGLFLNLL